MLYLFETPDGTILYQDTSGHWSGILDGLRPDVAILAAAGRGNIDGEQVEGVVDTAVVPGFLGVRTDDALLRFVGGETIMTGHHVFADVDQAEAERSWTNWLASIY